METGSFDSLYPVLKDPLLAREINWMETYGGYYGYSREPYPLLAREINWMETWERYCRETSVALSLYSLEKLIEWKPSKEEGEDLIEYQDYTLYSLEKLIEWKPSAWITS